MRALYLVMACLVGLSLLNFWGLRHLSSILIPFYLRTDSNPTSLSHLSCPLSQVVETSALSLQLP
jgi:hypothetical protein